MGHIQRAFGERRARGAGQQCARRTYLVRENTAPQRPVDDDNATPCFTSILIGQHYGSPMLIGQHHGQGSTRTRLCLVFPRLPSSSSTGTVCCMCVCVRVCVCAMQGSGPPNSTRRGTGLFVSNSGCSSFKIFKIKKVFVCRSEWVPA